jgi:hypothetical protein
MTEAVDGIALVVEQLKERVRDLEGRVSALEGQPQGSPASQVASRTTLDSPHPFPARQGPVSAEKPAGVVPIFGKAVLGIAGAYLLRAIAESGVLPKLPVLIVAIAYAALWMAWAARTHGADRFASAVYGVTSVLILSPMLWESTVSFRFLSPVSAGAALVAFTVFALALAWRDDLQVIPWIATLAMVFTALALLVASHELVPLTAALLAIAFAVETAACLGRQLSLRIVPAFAADMSVALLVYVMTSPENAPEGFQPPTPAAVATLCLILLAVYGGSVLIRTFALLEQITVFEIVQGVLAFTLAVEGSMRATQGSIAPELGVFLLLAAALCYWGALSRFEKERHRRDRRVSAAWAAALLLVGALLLFPTNLQILFFCLACVVAAFVYSRTSRISLGLHSALFLGAAATLSPLPNYVVNAMVRTVPGAPSWGVWTTAVSAGICFAVGSHGADNPGRRRLLWVFPAVLVGFAAAASVVAGTVWLASGHFELSPSRLSVIRTIVNCALALALGVLGLRWKRIELGWAAYAAVAFGALKLLFEDLRIGNAVSLVFSLLFYGLVLILLPRLMIRTRSES